MKHWFCCIHLDAVFQTDNKATVELLLHFLLLLQKHSTLPLSHFLSAECQAIGSLLCKVPQLNIHHSSSRCFPLWAVDPVARDTQEHGRSFPQLAEKTHGCHHQEQARALGKLTGQRFLCATAESSAAGELTAAILCDIPASREGGTSSGKHSSKAMHCLETMLTLQAGRPGGVLTLQSRLLGQRAQPPTLGARGGAGESWEPQQSGRSVRHSLQPARMGNCCCAKAVQ